MVESVGPLASSTVVSERVAGPSVVGEAADGDITASLTIVEEAQCSIPDVDLKSSDREESTPAWRVRGLADAALAAAAASAPARQPGADAIAP